MTDAITKRRIEVEGSSFHASFDVPQSQLKAVKDLLDANGIPYLADDEVETDGAGNVIGAYLDRGKDFDRVQELLDSFP
jgi:hypothetical protein